MSGEEADGRTGIDDRTIAAAVALAEQITNATAPVGQHSMVRHNRILIDDYAIGEKLGAGSMSTVYAATRHDDPSVEVAVKCIAKAQMHPDDMEEIVSEVQLLRELDHPHVVRFIEFYDEQQYCFIVTDMVRGGDLFMRIFERARYTETNARDVVKSLLEILDYLHRHGVAHRDIKVCGFGPCFITKALCNAFSCFSCST